MSNNLSTMLKDRGYDPDPYYGYSVEQLKQFSIDGGCEYFNYVEIPGRGLCAISKFMTTYGLIYGIGRHDYAGRYCYDHLIDCITAINSWDGFNDPDDEDWIKHKGGYSKEYLNYKWERFNIAFDDYSIYADRDAVLEWIEENHPDKYEEYMRYSKQKSDIQAGIYTKDVDESSYGELVPDHLLFEIQQSILEGIEEDKKKTIFPDFGEYDVKPGRRSIAYKPSISHGIGLQGMLTGCMLKKSFDFDIDK